MNAVSIELQDSRRLTGPNLLVDGPGAVIDGTIEGVEVTAFLNAWRGHATEVLDAVGWSDHRTAERPYAGGVTVFLSAPVDGLYAATELNEWAWSAAAAEVSGEALLEPLDAAVQRLRAVIDDEANPELVALQVAARGRGVTFLTDDEHASVGTGTGSRTWAVNALPEPEDISWDEVHDVPTVLVTGTNGKTTTVRMLASIVEAAGRTVGFTCTDGIHVGGEIVDSGDWSGPGGARAVLRNRWVEVAILETARGGMLRRGLAVDRADAALVTNAAADHLGEWGVHTVEDVATAKLVIARAVRHGGAMVVNADDPALAPAARSLGRPLIWITLEGRSIAHSAADHAGGVGPADVVWTLEDGWLCRVDGPRIIRLVEASAIPAAMGGAARHNVRNALGAAALAGALGYSDEDIRLGLSDFDASPERSPGRGNLFDVGGVDVMVDFVHNAHGFEAMAETVRRLARGRVGFMIGHAGDRDDEAIRELVRAAWLLRPSRVVIKEMSEYLRGREPGEIPAIIRTELLVLGASQESVSVHDDELGSARALLEWARPGDFLLLATHSDRAGVLELVGAAASE